MPKARIPLRQRLAKNLRVLSTGNGLSGHQIGKKSGVAPKTISNMMRAGHDPRLTQVEKVASVFGMDAWQLLAADLQDPPKDSSEVRLLLEAYSSAKPEGRKAIMQVAGIAAEKADSPL